MTIKVLEKTKGCSPVIFDCGDWFDLCTAEDIKLKAPQANRLHKYNQKKETPEIRMRDVDFDYMLIPLGIAIELPKGFEAIIAPRSSTFLKYGLIQTNSIGVIDNTYCGEDDEWKMSALATRAITIPKGTRIAQFRIQLSQKASIWQRIKWLLGSKPKLKTVYSLSKNSRGGFGKGTGNK